MKPSLKSRLGYARMQYAIRQKLREERIEKRDIELDYILYVQDQLILFFNCGDDAYADRCYNALQNGVDEIFEEVINYLYDHDDDNYIGKYMESVDEDFPNEKLLEDIEQYYKKAYSLYSEEREDFYPNKRPDDLYESIMTNVAREVKKVLNELSAETYGPLL